MVEESQRYLREMICERPMRALGRLAGNVACLIQNAPCCFNDAKQQLANTE